MNTHVKILGLGLAGLALACGDDEAADGPCPELVFDRAVLVAERFNTPDGRIMYMGVFPDLPTEVSVSRLTELAPNGAVTSFGKTPFFWNAEAGSMTKYRVCADGTLEPAGTLIFRDDGVTDFTGAHVFASETRAFTINGAGGRAVEWNPRDMTIVRAFDVARPPFSATNLEIQFFEPYQRGNRAFFPIGAANYDEITTGDRAVVAILDASTGMITYAERTGCLPDLHGGFDAAGNFYLYAERDSSFWRQYSETPNLPGPCILRIREGATSFEEGFNVDPSGVGVPIGMWPIQDTTKLFLAADPSVPFPSRDNLYDFYSHPVVPYALDVSNGQARPYPGIPGVHPQNSRKLQLDGVGYYQSYVFDAQGRVSEVQVLRLTPAGAVPAFRVLGGDVLSLRRLE